MAEGISGEGGQVNGQNERRRADLASLRKAFDLAVANAGPFLREPTLAALRRGVQCLETGECRTSFRLLWRAQTRAEPSIRERVASNTDLAAAYRAGWRDSWDTVFARIDDLKREVNE